MILHPNEIQTSCDSELSHSIMAKSVVFVSLSFFHMDKYVLLSTSSMSPYLISLCLFKYKTNFLT